MKTGPVSIFLIATPLALPIMTAPILALAQQAPTDPFGYTSRNPAIISQQISMALQFDRRALELLASTQATPESAETIRSLVYDSYVLVRYAHSGVVQIGSQTKFVNPVVQIEDDLMEQARGAMLQCIATLDQIRAGASEDLAPATEWLTRAVTQLEALQAVMP